MSKLRTTVTGLFTEHGSKLRFLVVGGLGFLVNLGGLTLFFHILGLPILIAQIISVELAILATFVGNNYWAFRGHQHIPLSRKLWRFHASALMGMFWNSLVTIGLVQLTHINYAISLAVGSAVGLIWNYLLYQHFVFRKTPTS